MRVLPPAMAAPSQIAPITARLASSSASTSGAVVPKGGAASTRVVAASPVPVLSRFGTFSDLGVPLAVLGIILAMIMPKPSFLLDMLKRQHHHLGNRAVSLDLHYQTG